jgi:chromosomal replication initiation ATPase DnaA
MQDFEDLAAKILDRRNIVKFERASYNLPDAASIFRAIGQQLSKTTFVVNESNQFVHQNCLNWLLGYPFECLNPEKPEQNISGDLKKGLYIAGPCGTGKSVLLRILAALSNYGNIEYEADRRKIKLVWAENRADDICNNVTITGIESVARLRNLDVLNINDFGSGQAEQVYMGNRINAIRLILEARGDSYGKFTLLTSNFPIYNELIKQQYGARVVSRLSEMCNYFELTGEDWRKKRC